MIDPLDRWREYGEKPDYAGLLTFGGLPYTEDPAELAGLRRRDGRSPDRRSRLRPAGHAVRAAGDPRGELPARAASRGRGRRLRRVLRMVDFGDAPGRARRPGALARCDRSDRRPGARGRRDPDRPRRRPLDRRARHPRVRGRARPGRPRPLRHAHGHRDAGLRRRGLARDADVPPRRRGRSRPDALRPDRPARLLARRGRVRMAEGEGDHELLRPRRPPARDRGRGQADPRDRRQGRRLSHDRRGRARPRLCAGNRDARARRPHARRSCSGPCGRSPPSSRWSERTSSR